MIDVFNELAMKYINAPIIFPIQKVQIKYFTEMLPEAERDFTTPNTLELKHFDAIFKVFRHEEYAKTCFDNPFITFRFNLDGKFYPRKDNRTFDDERFMNLALDSLNVKQFNNYIIQFRLKN